MRAMLSPASRTLPKKVASASVLFDWTSPSFASRFSTIAAIESIPAEEHPRRAQLDAQQQLRRDAVLREHVEAVETGSRGSS